MVCVCACACALARASVCVCVCVCVCDLALSGNFCVFFDVFMSPQIQNRSVTVRKRVINDYVNALFEQTLSRTSSRLSD